MGKMIAPKNSLLSINLEDSNTEVIEVYKKKLKDAKDRIPQIQVINIETSKQVQKLLQDSVGQIFNREH